MFRFIVVLMCLLSFSAQAHADGHLNVLLRTDKTALGNDLGYPEGKAMISAFELTVPVGGPITPHTHSFPVLIMVQEGEATITYEDGTVSVYKAGDAFIEDTGIVHSSENTGTVPVKLLVVAIGVDGERIMTPVEN